ncbi:MAG TPA: hypothetical protein VLR27_13815 [Acidimicrobiales bacterium]|nr:hypothetical protein [Acidimicrobiales bacterium]
MDLDALAHARIGGEQDPSTDDTVDPAMVDALRVIRSLEVPTGALTRDRTQQIHAGRAFVLAVGIVLVLVTVFTLNQLVQAAFQDLGQGL